MVSVPSAIKWLVTVPEKWTLRVVCEHVDGTYTFCAKSWDIEKNIPVEGRWSMCKNGAFHAVADGRVALTAFQTVPSWVPLTLFRPIARKMLPSRLQRQVSTFKQFKASKGK